MLWNYSPWPSNGMSPPSVGPDGSVDFSRSLAYLESVASNGQSCRGPHQPGDAAAAALGALALQDGMDARGPVGSARLVVDGGDLLGQLGVADRAGAGRAGAAGVEGGSGDLQQFTRPFDAVTCAASPPR